MYKQLLFFVLIISSQSLISQDKHSDLYNAQSAFVADLKTFLLTAKGGSVCVDDIIELEMAAKKYHALLENADTTAVTVAGDIKSNGCIESTRERIDLLIDQVALEKARPMIPMKHIFFMTGFLYALVRGLTHRACPATYFAPIYIPAVLALDISTFSSRHKQHKVDSKRHIQVLGPTLEAIHTLEEKVFGACQNTDDAAPYYKWAAVFQ